MEINYLTDPVESYQKAINAARTLEQLREAIGPYKLIANDALEVAFNMQPAEFRSFKAGLRKERKKEFAGEEWASKYYEIIMPWILFRVTTIAYAFGVPWGTAYLQMKKAKRVVERDGVAYLKEKEEES